MRVTFIKHGKYFVYIDSVALIHKTFIEDNFCLTIYWRWIKDYNKFMPHLSMSESTDLTLQRSSLYFCHEI